MNIITNYIVSTLIMTPNFHAMNEYVCVVSSCRLHSFLLARENVRVFLGRYLFLCLCQLTTVFAINQFVKTYYLYIFSFVLVMPKFIDFKHNVFLKFCVIKTNRFCIYDFVYFFTLFCKCYSV